MNMKHGAALVLLFGLPLLTLAGCGKAEKSPEKTPAQQSAPEGKPLITLSAKDMRKAGIQTKVLQLQDLSEQIALTGTIQANSDKLARVSPRVSGRVARVNANLGDRVKAGQVLALLESIEVGEARSAYGQARSEAALAEANFERARQLFAENIIPQKDYLRARSDMERAKAVLRAATGKLEMLGVAVGEGAGGISGGAYPLVAPFAGKVIEKKAVLGELAQVDQALFTLADLSTLWIETDLFEKDLGKVMPGSAASVTVSAYPGEMFRGRLTYISSTMDKTTRTVKARVEVSNPDGRLKPGMFANVGVNTAFKIKALWVPEEAVLLLQGQPTVFLAEENGFEPRAVETGQRIGGQVMIKSGLEAGEKVAVSGAYALKARLLKSQIGEAE